MTSDASAFDARSWAGTTLELARPGEIQNILALPDSKSKCQGLSASKGVCYRERLLAFINVLCQPATQY